MNIRKQDFEHLRTVIGSLMIKQFKGKNKQDQYRGYIDAIFEQFTQNYPLEHWSGLYVTVPSKYYIPKNSINKRS